MGKFCWRKGCWILTLLGLAVLGLAAYAPDIPAGLARSKYATPASRFALVDGMEVHYQDGGSGPAVILIHGSSCSLQTWDGWRARLGGRFRIIALDLPGHGLTGPRPGGGYDYQSMAAFLEHFATALGLERFALAGNSLGGAIALHYALEHPERVDRLILIDSLGYPGQRPPLILRLWGWPVLGRLLTVFTPRAVYAWTVRHIYGHPELVSPVLIDRYHELLLRAGNREATRDRFTGAVWDLDAARFASVRVPVLVMWGGRDPWFDPGYGRMFVRDIPGAQWRLYPDLGHVPQEEGPEETARDAAVFLER